MVEVNPEIFNFLKFFKFRNLLEIKFFNDNSSNFISHYKRKNGFHKWFYAHNLQLVLGLVSIELDSGGAASFNNTVSETSFFLPLAFETTIFLLSFLGLVEVLLVYGFSLCGELSTLEYIEIQAVSKVFCNKKFI